MSMRPSIAAAFPQRTRPATLTINNAFTIANRYGAPTSLLLDQRNINRIAVIERARNRRISAYSAPSPEVQGRSNYSSCGDNQHCVWNGSGWARVPACSGSWIGSITLPGLT